MFSVEDYNMQRIITDMEHALMCMPSDITVHKADHTDDIPTRDEPLTTRPYQVGHVPLKSGETSLSKPVVLPEVKFTEQSSSRQIKQCLPLYHEQQIHQMNVQSSVPVQLAKEGTTYETQILQRELEVKCAKLDLTCDQVGKERDSLNE
jgi:hypothetical protein